MAERTEVTPSDIGGGGGSDGSARGEAAAEQPRAAGTSAADVEAGSLPPRASRKTGAGAAAEAPSGHGRPASGRSDTTARPHVGKKPKHGWRDTRTGRVLELLAYLVMLVLVLVYFTGKGLFIYEGF